jgi:diguanylate cyclase (GGDEF)-like protein
MPNPHLAILVVDDAKFSSVVIGRTLAQAGYLDVRFCSSAAAALAELESRPANLLLADWLMPEMDGLELTSRVRQLDEASGHYTYVMLLTGREGENVLANAFDRGVDDFVSKSAMNDELVPRVFAADRLCGTLQRLMQDRLRLGESLRQAESRNLVDALTGLGNSRYLKQKLADSLRQVESRGGALSYLLIGLKPGDAGDALDEANRDELLLGVARRLQQLVRPLDVLARLGDRHFGLIALMSDLEACTPTSFRRLHEGLNLRAFKTREGFVTVKAAVSLVSLDGRSLPVEVDTLLDRAVRQLPEAYASGRVTALRLLSPR